MKNVIFNEKRDIENIINSGKVTLETVNRVIMSIAKYNLRVLEMNDEDNKTNIHQWLKKYYLAYVETAYDAIISDKVKQAHEYDLIYSDNLLIYQPELDVISKLDNVRMEKVMFALLCIAKLQRNTFNYQNGKYKLSLTNIFKLARVHIQSIKRDLFMHELLKLGFISAPFAVDGEERWVNCICEEGEPVLAVFEQDFEELAYVYLNWKNNGGYTRCKQCGKLIKQKKTREQSGKSMKREKVEIIQYCEDCAKDRLLGIKTINCVDCGKEVKVGLKNTATYRCEECQDKVRKEKYKKYNEKRRSENTTDQQENTIQND